MTMKLYREEDIQAIADAIRDRNGTSLTYTVSEMANAVGLLPTTAKLSGMISCKSLFSGGQWQTITGLDKLDTGAVADLSYMFSQSKAQAIDMDGLDTTSATTFERMFHYCKATSIINLHKVKSANLSNMIGMFESSDIIEINLTGMDTKNVTDMAGICRYAKAESIIFNGNDIGKVYSMQYAFQSAEATTYIFVGLNASSLVRCDQMFRGIRATRIELSPGKFEAPRVENVSMMFMDSSAIEYVDVSGLDMSSTTSMSYMFQRCSNLKTVKLGADTTTYKSNVTVNGLFDQCSALEHIVINGTNMLPANGSASLNPTVGIPAACSIYVPDDLVAAYQAAPKWSDIAGQIKGISEYVEN